MTIDKQALREELSTPAIGSKGHLRKLALSLLDELDVKEEQRANWFQMAQKLGEDLDAAERNIAETDQRNAELTAKIEPMDRRIAELERSETQLINERDSAESALNDAYKAVMGQAPEWSNWFSFENAIDEIELACELWRNQTDDVIQFRQHIANLEAQKADLMRHVLNAYEASALTMTLRKTVGYLPDYLRFCGIYGVDHEAIIDKLDYQSFVLARVNNEDLRQDEAGRYSKCEPPCGDDVAGQDAWFDAAESEGE
ncbi:hypothetical protein [Salmonella enterica]|uniref:hypothetical protein n=1 Tax=Salmonella enterica TaxID=28901 RepID=UPI00211797BF|nr:hypothetical protein [Salmonella enterica]